MYLKYTWIWPEAAAPWQENNMEMYILQLQVLSSQLR